MTETFLLMNAFKRQTTSFKLKSKVCPCFCFLNETHTSLKCLLFVSHFFDFLQDGHLPKLDTKSCSLPFFSHFL